MNNWNAVPKTFATDTFEAGNKIQQRQGSISLDQNSLGRSASEVLYWKAPKEALGDVVTLYDGTIDVHFVNDGKDDQAPSDDEFIWLRGNNIDIVHKLPQTQRFKANTNATYSVAVNEVCRENRMKIDEFIFCLSSEHLHVKMVHTLIGKISLWLYQIWILYWLKSIPLVVKKLLCKKKLLFS